MKLNRPTLGRINKRLTGATRQLNQAARDIRDAKFQPQRSILKIGEALAIVFDIQNEIYRERPDLLPKYMRNTPFGRELLSNSNGRPRGALSKRPTSRARRSPRR
jgi:hypothetical protein